MEDSQFGLLMEELRRIRALLEKHFPEPASPLVSKEIVPQQPPLDLGDSAWLDEHVRAAFGAYGKTTHPLSRDRIEECRRVMRQTRDREVIGKIIHGYAAMHGQSEPSRGFDPMTHFNLTTLLRKGNRAKYLEAYAVKLAESGPPPWPFQSRGESVAQAAARLRRERSK